MNRCSFVICAGKVSNRSGQLSIRLRARINGKKMELDIDHLPAKYWDQSKGVAIGPYRDKNLVFNNAISKAIDIEVRYKLSGQVLNLQKFKAEFLGNSIRGDVIIYMERAIKYRHSLDEIATSTMKQHLNVCKKMKQFFKQLSFGDITRENIQKFDLWNFETMSRNQLS